MPHVGSTVELPALAHAMYQAPHMGALFLELLMCLEQAHTKYQIGTEQCALRDCAHISSID